MSKRHHAAKRFNKRARNFLFFALCFLIIISAILSVKRPWVKVKPLAGGRYQLFVSGKPYIIKGICYNPIPIGARYDYDFWADPRKPWIVDGKLMQEMGANTVRIYAPGEDSQNVKAVISDLYKLYGIRTIMGNWLGLWDSPGPFYADQDFREKIKKEVLDMVRAYKDEPGILFWVLGNENNYTFSGKLKPWSSDEIEKEPDPAKRIALRARVYYAFVNELADAIHETDPNHPVALGNGELNNLDIAKEVAPDIDIAAILIYRGKSFGNLFSSAKNIFGKPVVLIEYGADAYNSYLKREDPDMQAFYLESQTREIYKNISPNPKGEGNCLGGNIFEWTDEWWKHDEFDPESYLRHDTEAKWSSGSYYLDVKAEQNLNMNEEWFGIVALNPELENGINKRLPRKAYYVIRDFWRDPYKAPAYKNYKPKEN